MRVCVLGAGINRLGSYFLAETQLKDMPNWITTADTIRNEIRKMTLDAVDMARQSTNTNATIDTAGLTLSIKMHYPVWL